MRATRPGLAAAAFFLALAGSARAGTYDVVSCSPSGSGEVNNAWVAGPVVAFNGETGPQYDAGLSATGSCAAAGLSIRSGISQSFSYWGNLA